MTTAANDFSQNCHTLGDFTPPEEPPKRENATLPKSQKKKLSRYIMVTNRTFDADLSVPSIFSMILGQSMVFE